MSKRVKGSHYSAHCMPLPRSSCARTPPCSPSRSTAAVVVQASYDRVHRHQGEGVESCKPNRSRSAHDKRPVGNWDAPFS